MNRGLLEKSWRDIWPATLGFGLLLFVVKTALSFVLPLLHSNMFALVMKMDFTRNMMSALIGTPIEGSMDVQVLQALPWVHPLATLIVFAHEVTLCTWQPAGEIDRGTIELLLGLPVSRWQVYVHYTVLWAISGLVVILIGLAGHWLGFALAGMALAPAGRIATVVINAWLLYLAIGCFALMLSCAGARRGRVVGAVIAVVIGLFLVAFVAGLWPPARALDRINLLTYSRPFFIFQSGRIPWGDMAVLIGATAVMWTAGGMIYQRRDIHPQ